MRAVRYIAWVLLHLVASLGAQPWPTNDSLRIASDNWNSFLTEEERLFYQSDYLPFSLAQKGRFSIGSWRGLPPGSAQIQFAEWEFWNPAFGTWNLQLTPRFRSWQTLGIPGGFRYQRLPFPNRPRVILTHFLDFVMNLSLVDIDFTRQYAGGGRLWLGGHNFLRQGNEPNNTSQIQTTSYFGQLEHPLNPRWQLTAGYFQAHDDFLLPPENMFSFTTDQFKERTILSKLGISGGFTPGDSSGIFITGGEFTDAYRRNRSTIRRNVTRTYGTYLYSYWKFIGLHVGVQNRLEHIRSSGTPLTPLRETQNQFQVSIRKRGGAWTFVASGGMWYNSAYGILPEGNLGIAVSTPLITVSARGSLRRQAHSTVYRSIAQGAPVFRPHQPGTIGVGDVSLTFTPSSWATINITAFTGKYEHAAYLTPDTTWQDLTFSNQGIKGKAQVQFPHIWASGEVTYNVNWQHAFAPRWHGVFHTGVRLSLFQGALRLRGIFTLNYFGRFYQLQFHRLLRAFTFTSQQQGPYPIADFRLMASIKTVTLYFVWENMLSTDYTFVSGTMETLRLFRLGVRWTLWN